MEWVLITIFAVDMFISFRVALKDDAVLVEDRSLIAADYYRYLHKARPEQVYTLICFRSVQNKY